MALWKVAGKQQHCGAPRRLFQGLPTLCGDSVLFVPNPSGWRRCPMLRARGPAASRRERHLRAFWRHEICRSRWPGTLRITTQRRDKLYCMSTLVRKRARGPTWTRRKKVLTTLCLETSHPHLFPPMLHLLLWLTTWRLHLLRPMPRPLRFQHPRQRMNLRRPSTHTCDRVRDARTIHLSTCSSDRTRLCYTWWHLCITSAHWLAPVIEYSAPASPWDNRDFRVLVNP